jgi:hypothetical protein
MKKQSYLWESGEITIPEFPDTAGYLKAVVLDNLFERADLARKTIADAVGIPKELVEIICNTPARTDMRVYDNIFRRNLIVSVSTHPTP